jgi:hypothetical protein
VARHQPCRTRRFGENHGENFGSFGASTLSRQEKVIQRGAGQSTCRDAALSPVRKLMFGSISQRKLPKMIRVYLSSDGSGESPGGDFCG